ncbi:hypothetical protein MJ563_21300 [Klebsiella pneumoniae]|nr:hypothetical protein MJ563_21300 [Klebsiella pneumoniae]
MTTAITSEVSKARKKMATKAVGDLEHRLHAVQPSGWSSWSRRRSRPSTPQRKPQRSTRGAASNVATQRHGHRPVRDLIASVASHRRDRSGRNVAARYRRPYLPGAFPGLLDGVISPNETAATSRSYHSPRDPSMPTCWRSDTLRKLVAPLIDGWVAMTSFSSSRFGKLSKETEEEQFACTLERGPALLDEELVEAEKATPRLLKPPARRHLRLPGRPDRRWKVKGNIKAMKLVLKPQWKARCACESTRFRRL